jgi:hypothetical protein
MQQERHFRSNCLSRYVIELHFVGSVPLSRTDEVWNEESSPGTEDCSLPVADMRDSRRSSAALANAVQDLKSPADRSTVAGRLTRYQPPGG